MNYSDEFKKAWEAHTYVKWGDREHYSQEGESFEDFKAGWDACKEVMRTKMFYCEVDGNLWNAFWFRS